MALYECSCGCEFKCPQCGKTIKDRFKELGKYGGAKKRGYRKPNRDPGDIGIDNLILTRKMKNV